MSSPDIESLIHSYQAGFEALRECLIKAGEVMDALDEAHHDPSTYISLRKGFLSDEYISLHLRSRVITVVELLVKKAVEAFSPKGSTITIDSKPWKEKYTSITTMNMNGDLVLENAQQPRCTEECYAGLSFQRIWDDLEAAYGNGKAEFDLYLSRANEVRRRFIIPGEQLNTVAGKVSLPFTIYEDSWSAKSIGYGSREDLAYFLDFLSIVATYNDRQDDVDMISKVKELVCGHSYRIKSREKIELCKNSHIVTYCTKFDFRFDPEFAQCINLFLSIHQDEESIAA